MTGTREPLATATRRSVLEAFQSALRREAHVLGERPELLWQQLANRLQWEEPPAPDLVTSEAARRERSGAPPWLRLRMQQAESRALIRTLAGHTGPVNACAFSPDGALLASAGDDHTLRVWDVASGRLLVTLTGHTGEVTACAFSPDGALLASAGEDGALRLWEAAGARERAALRGHTDRVWACEFSPDGALLASVSSDRTLKLWDVSSGRALATLPMPAALRRLAWHPWQPLLGTGDVVGQVHLVDVEGIVGGPPIRTAVDGGAGPEVRCPVCGRMLQVTPAQLGQEVACSQAGCAGRVRVNPFVVAVASRPIAMASKPAERQPAQPPAPSARKRRSGWRFWGR